METISHEVIPINGPIIMIQEIRLDNTVSSCLNTTDTSDTTSIFDGPLSLPFPTDQHVSNETGLFEGLKDVSNGSCSPFQGKRTQISAQERGHAPSSTRDQTQKCAGGQWFRADITRESWMDVFRSPVPVSDGLSSSAYTLQLNSRCRPVLIPKRFTPCRKTQPCGTKTQQVFER